MAYYDGETLSQRIARGAISIREALDTLIQLTRAVAAAHDAGVIHRDIKPANIYRASIVLAVEPRFKTAILWSGGLPTTPQLPEIDPINFAPRVNTPVLMLNGRDDFIVPGSDVAGTVGFAYRATPAADKGRGLVDGGHVFPFSRMIKDALDWLDRYLGAPN